jgi:type I restriction enzyme, S subunit
LKWPIVPLSEALASAEVFADGDWVESKDQDPNGDVRLVQLADVGDGEYFNKSARFLTLAKAHELRCTFLKPGDVLVARMPDPLGRACIFPGDPKPSVTVVDVCIIRPDTSKQDARWLAHCLNSPICRNQINGFATGTTRSRISRSNLAKIKIPLPPLPEQRRIAEILDKADEMRTKRRATIAQLDILIQSIFFNMFGDPILNPHQWPQEKLESYFNFRTGKLDSNAAVPEGEFPFFTCSQEDLQIDTYAFDCEALMLAGNNATADYSVKHYKGKFNAYQRTYVITLRDERNSYEYAQFVLNHRLAELKRISKGTNTKYLTLELLKRIRVPVPPVQLQNDYAGRVAAVESMKTAHRTSLSEVDMLFASLQYRAFRGEL